MRKLLLGAHATLVALLVVFCVASTTLHDSPDANIGAGLAVGAIGLMGLPWSWPLADSSIDTLLLLQVTALALLNLALHWALGAWLVRRRSRRV